MNSPYREIAKDALVNWNGLSEEEATSKSQKETIRELDGQVYALTSVEYAITGIAKQLNLRGTKVMELVAAVVNGPMDSAIFSEVAEKAKRLTESQKLEILETIHDGWVVNNSDENTFNKKVEREQLRQYAPSKLIGWNEVKSDLIFLTPILKAIGQDVNEEKLEEVYHNKVADYLKDNIKDDNDLKRLVGSGKSYYPILPDELNNKLLSQTDIVTEQIINNWNEKDPKTAEIFNGMKEQKTI